MVFELSTKVSTWIGGNDINTEGTFVWQNVDEFYKSNAAVYCVFTKLPSGFISNSQSTQHCVTLKETLENGMILSAQSSQPMFVTKTAYVGEDSFVPPKTIAATTSGLLNFRKFYFSTLYPFSLHHNL